MKFFAQSSFPIFLLTGASICDIVVGKKDEGMPMTQNIKQPDSGKDPKQRRKRGSRGIWILLVFLLIIGDLLGIGYMIVEHYYQTHFLDGTNVNGRDISRQTADQVRGQLAQEVNDYTLLITERAADGTSANETISGSEIGLEMVFDDELEKALEEQSGGRWLTRLGGQRAVAMDTQIRYDETAWQRKVDSLKCFSPDFIRDPSDAEISSYESGTGYSMIPEVTGNRPVREVIAPALAKAVLQLQPGVDLNTLEGAYEVPRVTSQDEALNRRLEKMNLYAGMKITYRFGDTEEVLDGDRIHRWIRTDAAGNVTLDTSEVEDFVVYLRKKYDTIFRPRTFLTTYGTEVELEEGDYGWWMNYTQEIEELKAQLSAGISGERTPVYYQTAASYGEHDYGDTYVEVNVTAQHLYFYQDGELVLESDFVSGNTSKGNGTPEGVYGITYKERNATLEGENYSSPVSFWMPFNGNVGLHDAPWRSEFGGKLYRSSGSHGCVNLPYMVAREIYSRVSAGTPVIVYHLDGTESGSITTQDTEDLAQAAIDAIDYIGTVEKTEESEKRIKRARELYDGLSKKGKKLVTNYDDLKAAEAAWKKL